MSRAVGFVIKLPNGNYYGGYGKPDKPTLVGAQTFDSKRIAEALIRKSKRFHSLDIKEVIVVEVILEEKENNNI